MRRELRRWTIPIISYNVAWNLLLFALNPAPGSIVLAWVWLIAGFAVLIHRRRERSHRGSVDAFIARINAAGIPYLRAEANRHVPVRTGSLRRSFILDAGEWVIPIPQAWQQPEIAPDRAAVIAALEHELGILGHESDCSICQAKQRRAQGKCHGNLGGGDMWRAFECPHDL